MNSDKLLEVSGPLETGMRYYDWFYPPVVVEELEPMAWKDGKGKTYGQKVSFGCQSGTYLATGAHAYKDRPNISEVPLERFIVDAVIVRVEVAPREYITLEKVEDALMESGEMPSEDEALLIATGWDRYWNKENYISQSPGLKYELVRWAIDRKVGILGSDIPSFDRDGRENFFPEFFATDTLLLAPLVNLTSAGVSRARLTALPLKIAKSCASPCRAFLELG
ncbi:MAG: cyclase family protein [Thaumarchaeota archaeon]|nr:cyclase family protein [Nitrososphaerota archaeon]